MFINSLKFNKNIVFKKYSKLFFFLKKQTIFLDVYNCIDQKPIKNFLFCKKNIFLKKFFFKNIFFKKKTKMHMWWIFKPYKNYNFIFTPQSY